MTLSMERTGSMLRMRSWGSLLTLCAILLAGCGSGDRPPLGSVTGAITVNGEPFAGVIVSFSPDSGRPATAVTDDSGRYRLQYVEGVYGCKVGPNTVGFFPPTGGTMSHSIPARYQGSSDLKVEVKDGSNTFDFDLKSAPNESTKPAIAD